MLFFSASLSVSLSPSPAKVYLSFIFSSHSCNSDTHTLRSINKQLRRRQQQQRGNTEPNTLLGPSLVLAMGQLIATGVGGHRGFGREKKKLGALGGRGVLEHSPLVFFFSPSLCRSFTPPLLGGWRHGYQGSPGTDNMAQTMAPSLVVVMGGSERASEGEKEGESGRGVEGATGTGPQGKKRGERSGTLVCRARTLYSITALSLSCSLSFALSLFTTPLSLSHTHTILQTHTGPREHTPLL